MPVRLAPLVLIAVVGCSSPKAEMPVPPPTPVVHIQPGAAALIIDRKIALAMNDPFWFRISMSAGTDRTAAPYQFDLIAAGPRANEYEYVSNGIRCLVPRDQMKMLQNCRVDADVEEGIRRFRVENPQVGEGTPVWIVSPEP